MNQINNVSNKNIVWLASYPRSGNTYLRTILWQCFQLPSASIYPRDLGGNKELEKYVGHIEHGPDNQIRFDRKKIPMLKTHEHSIDNKPAIYVIRDGRAASVSLWEFYNRSLPLEAVINGQHRFGTWSDHVKSWNPWERDKTLLIRYEDMRDNPISTINNIAEFLSIDPIKNEIPDRETIVKSDGRWVRSKSNWASILKGSLLERFEEINGEILKKAEYF